MGILSNTVSICQFRVAGNIPDDILERAGQLLAAQAFQPIDQGIEEASTGWVTLDDPDNNDFLGNPGAYRRDHYLTFSLRKDQRKISSAVMRRHLDQACKEFLAQNPGLQRVPKPKKDELREAVRGALLQKTLPTPSVIDAVWDTRSHTVTVTSLSASKVEVFENVFKNTFDGMRLVAITPYARAEQTVDPGLQPALAAANQAKTDAVLDQIEQNTWLGTDFLRWLLYQTMNESSEYTVNRPGPVDIGDAMVAYINDKVVLFGTGEEGGVQKVVVSGPQNRYQEVRAALEDGKTIAEATIYMEKEENLWKFTLKGEQFHLASLKSPGVKLEKDDMEDEEAEKQAIFFERMYLVETGLQMFDSLFSAFLSARLSPAWSNTDQTIADWAAEAV